MRCLHAWPTWCGEGRLCGKWLHGLGEGAGGAIHGTLLQLAREGAKVLVCWAVGLLLQLRARLGLAHGGGLGRLHHLELCRALRLGQLGQRQGLRQRLEDRAGLGQATCTSGLHAQNLDRRLSQICDSAV